MISSLPKSPKIFKKKYLQNICSDTNCNIPKEYYENLINKIQDKIMNAFNKTISQEQGKFKTLI